ncbi:uncharacterized protein LOC141641320 [Silene latifolia]|uniref:uncharacterized protein LOC141641320 n=1 Tax=Silene latifolia TaxID=37657 RepID=UPI003D786439
MDLFLLAWRGFKETMRVVFVPEHIRSKMRAEFDSFKMTDEMTVESYHNRFMELAEYVSDLNFSDEILALRFEQGLTTTIKKRLAASQPSSMDDVYQRAGHAERIADMLQEERKVKGEKRKIETPSEGAGGSKKENSTQPKQFSVGGSSYGGGVSLGGAIKDVSSKFSHYQLVHNNDMHYNGRIWIFWNPVAITLTVLHRSAQHMHCSLLHIASQKHIEVTFVYAFNARHDRRELWTNLQSISSQMSVPWLCFGDFNVVLNMDERLGSTHVQLADIAEFSQCLDTCSLVDHPATGCHYTWNNKQGDGLSRWVKLDRILASPQWFASLHYTATFMNAGVSDHSPCLVNVDGMASPCRSTFKYLNCWALSPQFQDTVHMGWNSYYYGGHIVSLFQKLKRLKSGLRKLHTSSFTNLTDKVATCKSALKHCQDKLRCSPLDSNVLREEKVLVQEYLQVKKAEMQVLYQRAKVQHLQLGDLSTQYFYSKISAINVRNNIGSILDEAGFKNAVLEFFYTCSMPKVANSTLLVLIPKMETPLIVKDFRPIACCTTFYKVISKILANRLKQVLNSIVGPEQAALVADRDIFDNTMLAHELVSKYGRAYLTPRCLLKVDIRKAFDSVNWTFLKDCMLILNFLLHLWTG